MQNSFDAQAVWNFPNSHELITQILGFSLLSAFVYRLDIVVHLSSRKVGANMDSAKDARGKEVGYGYEI